MGTRYRAGLPVFSLAWLVKLLVLEGFQTCTRRCGRVCGLDEAKPVR
jgi:hypothetical protein